MKTAITALLALFVVTSPAYGQATDEAGTATVDTTTVDSTTADATTTADTTTEASVVETAVALETDGTATDSGGTAGDTGVAAEEVEEVVEETTEPVATEPAATAASPAAAVSTAATDGAVEEEEGMDFSIESMMAHLSIPVIVVLLLLAIMLLWCMYVAVERMLFLKKSQDQSIALNQAMKSHFDKRDGAGALKAAKNEIYTDAFLGHVLVPGLSEFIDNPNRHGIDAAERAIDTVMITEGETLRKGLNILATTGATAPFVGLVGTIFGIINAFQAMGSGEAGLKELAPAIGEALVTTAIGIIVAIVGVWLFNFFTAKIEAITNKMSVTAQVLIDWCEKELIAEDEDEDDEDEGAKNEGAKNEGAKNEGAKNEGAKNDESAQDDGKES